MIATIKPTITNEAVNISSNIIRTIPAIRGANWRGIYSTVCFFTRHSLVRGICFTVCMYVCLFVCSVNDFSTTRGPIHAKVRMPAYSGSRCVFSPSGGWRPPAGGKRGKGNFRYYGSQRGNFYIFAVFERYLGNACTDPHQILFM